MCKLPFLCILLILIKSITCFEISKNNTNSTWEILVYVQRWTQTACLVWKQTKEGHTCELPPVESSWVTHGIWPNKIGEKEGPNFCNKSIHFNMEQLKPIENDLKQHWTNIENGTGKNSLWKHEWLKHGTCCSNVSLLNTQLSFFNQGLKWLKIFNMTNVLSNKNIIPSNSTGYNVTEIHQAVVKTLNVTPMIQCDNEHKTKNSLLSEIRICFNKTLFTLVDCSILNINNTNKDPKGIITNCLIKKPVYYLDSNNGTKKVVTNEFDENSSNLYVIYRILQFLIWITL